MQQVIVIFQGINDYFTKITSTCSSKITYIFGFIILVLFPEDTYWKMALGLLGLNILDFITKYYSISKNNNGFFKAWISGKITADKLGEGTKTKMASILVLMCLTGLLYHVSQFRMAANVIATIVYSFMGLREAQSIAENMVQAGHKNWAIIGNIIKKKEYEIIKEETNNEESNKK